MKKTEELLQELRVHTKAIDEIANELLSSTEEKTAGQHPEPCEEKPMSLEDVRAVLVEISRAGHTDFVKDMLSRYGATKLSEVKPQHYKDLLKEAEEFKNAI